ncbi:MAG: MraY family glycosyltransferase [Inquilinaceae bacterium]
MLGLSIAAAALATGLALRWLKARAFLDRPNHRSSHTVATPRGGGLAVVPVVLAIWVALGFAGEAVPAGWPVIVTAAAALAILSWHDDRRGLSPAVRLAIQALAVATGLAVMPSSSMIFQGALPLPIDRILAFLLWLWFVNLVNFMDGIDGITGAELACVGLGLALTAWIAGLAADTILPAVALTGASLGFLVWNWAPARVFLGDVGSVPLGYVTGWLLLQVALSGLWVAALIVPLYYLADSTWTLATRLVRGEKVWQAHRQHFYQRATQAGRDHGSIVRRILLANAILIGCAAASVWIGAWALVPAAVTVAILLIHLGAGTARGGA